MRVAFFGTYNREHSANRIAAAAVRAAGCEIVEFHEPLWERTRDKHAAYFSPVSLLRLARQWAGSAWRLARDWRRSGGAPVAVVGFNGQLDVLLLRLLAPRHGPRIVFAPLVSLTETLVDDRHVYREGSPGARLLALLDRLTAAAADVVVVDSEEHRRYFVERLGVAPSRLLVCHLGADPSVFLERSSGGRASSQVVRATGIGGGVPHEPRRSAHEDARLEVLYFGQYLPLHGLDVIVDAIGRLAVRRDVEDRLRFTFIGTGEERQRIEPMLRATRADVCFVDWVAYEDLARRIAAADIVLGIFGASTKARMVIPNKVYEAAAVGSAIITADTPAIREVFEPDRDLVVCEADGLALADAIASLADPVAGERRRRELAEAARARMLESFSAERLGRCWSVALRGADALPCAADGPDKVGVAVLCFQDARRTLDCLYSVAAEDYPALDVLVVDNGSTDLVRAELLEGIRGIAAEPLLLERNLGYAGANDVAMQHLFERGCRYVLLLNQDTLLARGSIDALVRAARSDRRRAPLGPRVSEGRPGARPTSLGERYRAALLWMPRALVRVRSRRQQPYAVSGVTGCALLIPRELFERTGGFDQSLFAYYEEVDLCLRARESGFVPTVVPEAEVGHAGARGFAGGMTPLAAWLKARNLRIVGSRHAAGAARAIFHIGYWLLIVTSSVLYVLRGRRDVAAAMIAGSEQISAGPPPDALFAASGYPGSGHAHAAASKLA